MVNLWMLTLSSGDGLKSALGKTTISDRHQIRVRVNVNSRVRVMVRFGSLTQHRSGLRLGLGC